MNSCGPCFFPCRWALLATPFAHLMKRFLNSPACLAIFASWLLGHSAHAQTNTNTRFAALNQGDLKDVLVSTPYTPYGDKNDLNRYGDDGSAAIVEASGQVIWRTSDNVYRVIPNSTYAKPMFVSNAACIVWTNAYDPSVTTTTTGGTGGTGGTTTISQDIKMDCYQLDASSGQLYPSALLVEGNKVLDTPVITTTSVPYTIVTANVADRVAATNAQHAGINLFVYRMSLPSLAPQLLSTNIVSTSTNGILTNGAETVAGGADGSQIVRLRDTSFISVANSGVTPETGVWTMFAWINTNGVVKPLFSDNDAYVLAVTTPIAPATVANYGFAGGCFYGNFANNDYPIIRPVMVSAARFVFGANRYDLNNAVTMNSLYNYSRDPVADQIQVQPTIALPFPGPATTGEVIPLPNFNQQGVSPVFATQDASGNLTVFNLQGNIANFLYKATLPQALGIDAAVTRINANPGYESIALRDATNGGVVWLHNGLGHNLVSGSPVATTNYTLISELWGRPLFVTPGELIVWTNALATIQPNGTPQPVSVKHYGRNVGTGAIAIDDVQVYEDATVYNFNAPGAIRGTQVFAPFPFTQDPALWRLETGEKLSGSSLRFRIYQMLNPDNVDQDGDGIIGALENFPFYVIPGNFTYAEAMEDAKRRGGHLATINSFGSWTPAQVYAGMQTAIKLAQANSPLPLPATTVPYPLWIGLQNVSSTWQWQDTPLTDNIAGNWAPGEPSGVVGRTCARLTSAQKWEASNPSNTGSYLLELTPTDPLAKDTDGDGASDFDELFRLITDPTTPNFFSPPLAVTVPFTSPAVYGGYEGFLTAFGQGPAASFTLSVTNKGGFTGRITGMAGAGTIRGTFSATGTVTAVPVSTTGGLNVTLSMWIAPANPSLPPDPLTNPYRVSGRLNGLVGDPTIFELRRPGYSKTNPSPDAGNYTLIMPAATFPKEGQPSGDGYLYGTISTNGTATLRGKTADGQTLSWSGNEVEGNFLSFYSLINNKQNNGFVGSNLFVRDSAAVSTYGELAGNYHLVGQGDIDGNLVVTRSPVIAGNTQIAGYRYNSDAYGSLYQAVNYTQLPAFSEFFTQPPAPNNAVMMFIDGIFSGQNVIMTWAANNKLTIPQTQTRSLSASINGKTGEMTGNYSYNDPNNGYAKSSGSLAGVVLQKSAEVRGYYVGGTTSGQVILRPNFDGTPAPVTLISPLNMNNASYLGLSYWVYITASEPWTVNVPAGWVNVTPTSGNGNGKVLVTITKNTTASTRQMDLTIAGIDHHINQLSNPNGGSSVTISPVVKTTNYLGDSYTVTVKGLVNGSTSDFSSTVSWVTVTPAANLTSATVTVAAWPFYDSGFTFTPRTANVTIGGVTHTVIQTTYYAYWDYYYY